MAALESFRQSGRRLALVTGRELPDLIRVFPRLDLFDRVVAENGALLYTPATRKEKPLAPPPPEALIERLRAKRVEPLSLGRSIVATWEPNEVHVLEAIRELGLEWQITFNKGAVMVLPAGVNKASGLKAALEDMGLSAHNVVAVGDAENDHAFLKASGFAVAVANALPSLREEADLVTSGARGEGVQELIAKILEADAGAFGLGKSGVEVGLVAGKPLTLPAACGFALIAGLSGGGKSTLATSFLERFLAERYQICVFDPEGDYAQFPSGVILGDAKKPPDLGELMKLMERPEESAVVNLLAVTPADRPAVFARFLSALVELRARTGRPHWLLVDEAHHVLPRERDASVTALPQAMPATLFITVHPDALARDALERIDDVFAVGDKAAETIAAFCQAAGRPAPSLESVKLEHGRALHWRPGSETAPEKVSPHPTALKAERHTRKYAEGALGEDKSFYFRGPGNALNLRAQNLTMFTQIADGVDDGTWLHHLKAHDYSRWLREAIKDKELADEVRALEDGDDAGESRRAVREAIEKRYTAPAE